MLESAVHGAPRDMVLLHGAGGNNLVWRRTMQGLSGAGRALAVNLPGHPTGDITCKTVEEYSEVLGDFIVESGLERPVVCGHSMGSAISLELAIRRPEVVGGLVLVGAGARLGVDPRVVEGLRKDPRRTIEQVITPMSFFSIDLGLGREARAALSFTNIPVFLNDYLACDGFDVRDLLVKIAKRTLIVCGDGDRMTPPKWSHYLNQGILGSELFFVKDSGHMLPLEKPEPLSKLIQSFLAGLSR
ncbi:MAG: alpha/beta hydrolase [Thaumarchaeota archaeon]|nr:alpha/beta hydrolase [Nitrososphaerota archaeon]